MKTVSKIGDLKGKKILLRVNFDVAINEKGEITERFKIDKQKEMINWLMDKGAKTVMLTHSSQVDSFINLVPQLAAYLGRELGIIKSVNEVSNYLGNYKGLALLDNIRQNNGEKKNDPELGRRLASGFDIFINNDFAECHREYMSVSAITNFLPSYAGLLLEKETDQLEALINTPKEGKIIILGGAKASTKIPVIKNFLNKSDKVLVGGVISNDILKAKGVNIGQSVADDNCKELLSGLNLNDVRIILPEDFNILEDKIFDIGPKAIKNFTDIVGSAKMIIWNGPLGVFEDDRFATGTNRVAEAIAESNAFKVLGGGDTVAAVDKLGLLDKFDFVSTGGGAMLAFLAGNRLPGLEALGYYESRWK